MIEIRDASIECPMNSSMEFNCEKIELGSVRRETSSVRNCKEPVEMYSEINKGFIFVLIPTLPAPWVH
jgi:hypothetical protein